MPQARKTATKRSGERDKYHAELTSSQLVIGICVLMLFGLACFLVGVLVGKFDAGPAVEQTARAEAPVPARTVRLAPPQPKPIEAPATNPPIAEPDPVQEPAPAVEEQTAPAPDPEPEPAEPRVVSLPQTNPEPEPEPDTSNAGEPAAQAPAEPKPAEAPEPAQTPAQSPPDESTGAEVADTSVPEPDLEPEAQAPDVLEPDLEPVQPAEAPRRGSRQLTVQIGAFSQQANAELAKKKVEAGTNYPVFLVDSPSGTLVKVHVGVFESRAEAEAAQRELSEKLSYNESIITKHSIALTQAPSN